MSVDLSTPCVLWEGHTDRYGYGIYGRELVHRRVYIANVGPISPGLTIDHVCHNADQSCKGGRECPHRRCINWKHMEVVTPEENVHRIKGRNLGAKTHCPAGHPFDESNTYVDPHGSRICKKCRQESKKRYRARGGVY